MATRETQRGRRDVEIVSHNREDEFAKMPQGDSEGDDDDDDEAKVSEFPTASLDNPAIFIVSKS